MLESGHQNKQTTLNEQHQAGTVILATGTGMACEDGGGRE